MSLRGILSWSLDVLPRAESPSRQHKLKVPLQHSQVRQESTYKGGPLMSLNRIELGTGFTKTPRKGPWTPSFPRCVVFWAPSVVSFYLLPPPAFKKSFQNNWKRMGKAGLPKATEAWLSGFFSRAQHNLIFAPVGQSDLDPVMSKGSVRVSFWLTPWYPWQLTCPGW